LLTVALLFIPRIRGVSGNFWMLGDQIRDWRIALGPLVSLPLIGPDTHVHGYTIGPAFYWILWVIRVVVGPWFHNLPHAGGIGQALLQSAADALLLTAVWRRTQSVWLALTTVVLVGTGPFDLALSGVIWNPLMGSMLAKTATGLILLDWHRGSAIRIATIAAVAWSAVHAYTGCIFVALSVFAALLADACVRRDWPAVWRRAAVIAGVVAALQIPYALHQLSTRFTDSAMGAVTDSLRTVLTGKEHVHFGTSATYFAEALTTIQSNPWPVRTWIWILLYCAAALAVRYRNDPSLLAVTLLPQVAAIAGYALWLGNLDHYYYLSLAPAVVLTIVLGAAALVPARAVTFVGIALFIGALSIVPLRLREAAPLLKMPEYGVLVAGSREVLKRGQPMRSIESEFALPSTSDPEFIFRIMGGRIDRQAPWRAVILRDGRVTYITSTQ
jgi:hypothetical protein